MYGVDVNQSNFDSWSRGVYSFIIIPWELWNKTSLGERVPSQVFSERHGDMVPHRGGEEEEGVDRKVWKKNNTSK